MQGVGFRYYIYQKALVLGVNGWVRNLTDGRVECCGEADSKTLEIFENHLRTGPSSSRVDVVKVNEHDLRHYSKFSIEALIL